MKGSYKYTYLYVIITLIFLTAMSYIKQVNEGFVEAKQQKPWYIPGWYTDQWYKSDYFIIPFIATLVLIGPIVYLIYKTFLVPVNQSFTALA